jgi:hypothetical protein
MTLAAIGADSSAKKATAACRRDFPDHIVGVAADHGDPRLQLFA